MIERVKEVIKKLEELSPERQMEIAKIIEDELKWDNAFRDSRSELDLLAEEAKKEYNEGKTSDDDWK